ncbi:MAG: hypothetical protein ACK5NC_03410 [Vibrio sp.]
MATLNIRTDSVNWAPEWEEVSKFFNIQVLDDSSSPVPEVDITCTYTSTGSANLELVNSDLKTDETGSAEVEVKITGAAEDEIIDITLTAPTADGDASTVFTIQMESAVLASPVIPQSADGKLDDADIENGITINIVQSDLSAGDVVNVCWTYRPEEDNPVTSVLEQTVNSSDVINGYVVVNVPDSIGKNLSNGTYVVRYEIIDPAGNGDFSEPFLLIVEHDESSTALPILLPATFLNQEDQLINTADYKRMQFVIPVTVDQLNGLSSQHGSLYQATEGEIQMHYYNRDGVTLSKVTTYDLASAIGPAASVGEGESYIGPGDGTTFIPVDAFTILGEGRVGLTYNLTVALEDVDGNPTGETQYMTSNSETLYVLDIVPPKK